MSRLRLLVARKGSQQASKDISALVQSVKWSGRHGSAPRTLAATLLDDDGYGHGRASFDPESGDWLQFFWDETELFRGLVMSQQQSNKKTMTVTAYDRAIYLANNRDTFSYSKAVTATEVFTDVCKRFSIPYTTAVNTKHRISEFDEPSTTGWDAISSALSSTYDATGVRYFVRCVGDKLELIERRENVLQLVLETGVNVMDYSRTRSIEDIKTYIKIVSDDGETLAEARDSDLESRIGIFADIESPPQDASAGALVELARSLLKEKCRPSRPITMTALGKADVVTGVGVYVILPQLGVAHTYYVEEDTHTFDKDHHTMRLQLALATDTEVAPGSGSAALSVTTSGITVGSIVQFKGGSHYVSSTSGSPVGGTRIAGAAKCTAVARGAKHPYHLIGGAYSAEVDGKSDVYGWVDEGTVAV